MSMISPDLLFTRTEAQALLSSIEGALRVLDELMLQTATLESGPNAYLSLQQQIVELTQSRDVLQGKLGQTSDWGLQTRIAAGGRKRRVSADADTKI